MALFTYEIEDWDKWVLDFRLVIYGSASKKIPRKKTVFKYKTIIFLLALKKGHDLSCHIYHPNKKYLNVKYVL